MYLRSINLSLSNRCNASCIWCPEERGTKHNFDMPWELAKKIIDELAEQPVHIQMIHLSENGEALYNPDFLKIVRYTKEKLPNTAINLLSNFGLMTEEIARALLSEKLLSSVQVNIDGHDSDSYKAVKGISYSSVIKHVKTFIALMEEFDPNFDFTINVMTAFEYAVTVSSFFGTAPDRTKDPIPYSSFELSEESLRKFAPENVRISRSKSGLWAERNLVKKGFKQQQFNESEISCPMLKRVQLEAFIAPNGDWYACCLDDNNDLVLGNVNETSLHNIFHSHTRLDFLEKLEARKFEEIGYPCNTVVCCQTISIPPETYNGMTKQFKKGDVIVFKQV